MTEPDPDARPATHSIETVADDLDSWRDDIALITPSGPIQWLRLPLVYVLTGVLVSTVLMSTAHGRAPNLQGWVLIVMAGIFILWGVAFAWIGRRASLLYEVEESQRYVKLELAGVCCLCILATVAGVISGAVIIAITGFITLWIIRSQQQVPANASQFRLALADILRRAFLVEGIVMTATSLASGSFALLVIDDDSRLASQYIGGGAVLFLVGALTTAMALQQRARHRSLILAQRK
jgi:hypothetical protein